jgi:exopolysaccharide biosynthesis polyprenyl glycosylphosphotransferase
MAWQLPLSERKILLAAGDLAAVNLAVTIALRIWTWVGRIDFDLAFVLGQSYWYILLSGLWLTLASANDFYNLALTARWIRSQLRLLIITFQLLIVYLLIFFFSERDALPRLFIIYYAVASYMLIAAWRLTRPFLLGWRPSRRRVIVIGTGWEARTIIEAIREHAPQDYEIAAVVDDGQPLRTGETAVDMELVPADQDVAELAARLHASEIILATQSGAVGGPTFQGIMDCYEKGISLRLMPLLYEELTGRVPIEHVGGQWNVVLPIEGRSLFDPYLPLKRLMDVSLSLLGLMVFAAMLPLLALVIVLDSWGPVFYTQERVGQGGRLIRMVKLRSMKPDAEVKAGPLWAIEGDPRVTRVGKFLRRTRLDELPQLYNVLIGEMSLIGPRPERPFFVQQLQDRIPFYRTRLAVLPGLTGWAQVSYRYGSSEHDALVKLQYDLYYIRHRSILLDGLILLRTVGRVLRMQGT